MYKFFFICLILGLLVAGRAHAFIVSPSRYLLTVKPGETATVAVTIKNDKTETINYNLLVLTAEQDNEGHPVFSKNASEAENWVKPETEFISVAGRQKKTVNFFITAPSGAYPGFYYLGLAVQERNLNAGQISLTGRLVVLLSLQVAGEAREILRIDSFDKQKDDKEMWNFFAVLENKGNVDLPLRGKIAVKNWLKKEVGRQTVYLGNNLLPGATRNLTLAFDQEKLSWSPWYWASLETDYGRMGAKTAATVLVWGIFPVLLLVILVLVLLLVKPFKVFLKRHKIKY